MNVAYEVSFEDNQALAGAVEDLGSAAGKELLPKRQVENLGAALWYVVIDRLADHGRRGANKLVADLRLRLVLLVHAAVLSINCLKVCHTNEVGSEKIRRAKF